MAYYRQRQLKARSSAVDEEKIQLSGETLDLLVQIAALIVSEYLAKQASKEEGEEDRGEDHDSDTDPLIVEN
ncbi:hypothetical protein EL26_02925 [Tumebacillus flagellatus]|uniref:Uncharacterized protein n=1 Tax=Tumebacillus flagellatus TaxID=1157490 RepID=A0A074MGW4_9BACL|nr:hypothetical protein EL26_02925 [Tumebacillus flagellatus]